MLKKVFITATLLIVILALIIVAIDRSQGVLFYKMPWFMAGATILGIISGVLEGWRQNTRRPILDYQIDRHTIDSFLEHWGTATGIILLMISGYFLKYRYRRIFSMNLHFLGLIMTLYFGTYFGAHFLVSRKYKYCLPNIKDIIGGTIGKYLLRVPWKDTGKYLASQKSAFLAFAVLGIGIFITGTIKVLVFYYSIPFQLIRVATQIHDIFAGLLVLMLLIHILSVVIVRSNRRLLSSLFTGKVKPEK